MCRADIKDASHAKPKAGASLMLKQGSDQATPYGWRIVREDFRRQELPQRLRRIREAGSARWRG